MHGGKLTWPSLSQPFEKGHCLLLSLGWSLACPWHPEPLFKQNIITSNVYTKMPFSVPLLGGTQVLCQECKPPQVPKFWRSGSEKMAKNRLRGNRLETIISFFLYIFNCSRRLCMLNSKTKLLNWSKNSFPKSAPSRRKFQCYIMFNLQELVEPPMAREIPGLFSAISKDVLLNIIFSPLALF